MGGLTLARAEADHAVFIKREGDQELVVTSSVDDLMVTGTTELVAHFRREIQKRFEMTDGGKLRWILNIEVQFDVATQTARMRQLNAIDALAARFNLENAHPVSTPLDPNARLTREHSPKTQAEADEMADVPYRQLVGSLMYLAVATRPDISYAVQYHSQWLERPGRAHWESAKRVVRYLMGTRERWLVLGGSRAGLVGYTDADWGTSTDSRHSISGYVFTLGGGAISWSAKKQAVVALSSTEAEYIAITHAAKEALWLRALLADVMGPEFARAPIPLFSDNKSAIALARDNTFHPRTKHIDIRYHWIREVVERGDIELDYMETARMPADAFTKALARARLNALIETFGLRAL